MFISASDLFPKYEFKATNSCCVGEFLVFIYAFIVAIALNLMIIYICTSKIFKSCF